MIMGLDLGWWTLTVVSNKFVMSVGGGVGLAIMGSHSPNLPPSFRSKHYIEIFWSICKIFGNKAEQKIKGMKILIEVNLILIFVWFIFKNWHNNMKSNKDLQKSDQIHISKKAVSHHETHTSTIQAIH